MVTAPWWLITTIIFITPFLFFAALGLWLYVFSRRLPYAEDRETKDTLEGLRRIAGRW